MISKGKPSHPEKKKTLVTIRNVLLVLVVIFFIVFLVFFSGIIRKDCKNDLDCFNSKAYACKAAKVNTLINDNVYEFTIYGPSSNTCVIHTTLVKMADGVPLETREKLEGKDMTCHIPRSILKEQSIVEVNGIIDYCSGPLKEALYEVLIEKMYALIIQNFNDITKDVKAELIAPLY